ncbi:hypothetical protein JCM19301_1253 [Jejuia pallidilutea]|uniref:Uncharacterized protein n=1 Tax=Jejuia pallidilutea TaxID=504487 RepID=A0A090VWT0_9FLAO|nr:hypothetical protein JCM19301_1253 [Jejuia pallidilutea]GAL73444.1 hypothetical protein JCM19302_2377 [Jejuia pallidilutea]GAL89929.1 hypothetical protein JCM19538_1473 [Jejuia pallidilutea]
MGTAAETRYIKLKTIDELNDLSVNDFIKQAANHNGWK